MKRRPEILDFRSDTVTRPTAPMRAAMAAAEVGDDVFGEDPTVNALEERVALLFGREAALFCASGTMSNLIALGLHCGRGDEVILERRTHSFAHEVLGATALFGVGFLPLASPDGILAPAQIEAAIREDDIHEPRTRLVVIENTANLTGGRVVSLERLRAIRSLSRARGLRLHLDGARIWNAAAALGTPLRDFAAEVDTLSCCLSKGLGCPVGSMLVGDRADILRGRKLRKMLGGGMRQAGVIAAAGLYALDHHLERLADDHRLIADLAAQLPDVLPATFSVQPPETNILIVHTDGRASTDKAVRAWSECGLLTLALSETTIRLVAHLDLPRDAVAQAIARIAETT